MNVRHLIVIADKHDPFMAKEVVAEFSNIEQTTRKPQLVQAVQYGFG